MGALRPNDLWLKEGAVLLERYELKTRVAEGGMGVVWKALDQVLGAPVAIKFLKSLDEAARTRFFEESRIAARLSSPHVVRVFDVGTYLGVPFMVMEYLEGKTLRELLLIRGRLPPMVVIALVQQVAEGLAVAHAQGVVHRDIKPANIFMVGRECAPFAKILDFGVAKVDSNEWTSTGSWLGTPHYVSPEQALDASAAEPATDIWALAVIAYECLTGKRPFDGSSIVSVTDAILHSRAAAPSALEKSLPKAFDLWIQRALHRDRKHRPLSVLDLAEGIEACFSGASDRGSHPVLAWDERTRDAGPQAPSAARLAAIVLLSSLASGVAGYGVASRAGSGPPRMSVAPDSKEESARLSQTEASLVNVVGGETNESAGASLKDFPSSSAAFVATPEESHSRTDAVSRSRKGRRAPVDRLNDSAELPDDERLWRKRL